MEMSQKWRRASICKHFFICCFFRDENESHNWTKKGTTQESSASTSLLSANLAGLDKFTEYEVVISAFNEQGQGPPTQSFMVTTLEDGEFNVLLIF